MKRGRRKGGSKDKVFGCDLLEHLATTNQEIPPVLRSCSEFIEEYGVVDGIYRLSGVSSNTQKLRSEFDSEGTADLYKDVYMQDIHCVSSLCKAYFRELPNPLLTYQLYDRFAEAVAVQLEDERLVKIKDVLKELPEAHYKTLEYLMRHLVKMATFSSQTNMHARNLAIVWAPNLLRSKDIEATGFNGTAAFMEVRVQSIVVEFILTHVAQLFPEMAVEPGYAAERRKSLPSPSALPGGQDEPFFKALPFQFPGNMSPGDGPPPMRPYHAIIDGTDKRKGSLKGRKWKSIFNLGGRLQDPRKKSKYTPKEKEKTTLRPAKSMDSLSSGPYAQEDPRHASPHLSPTATPSMNSESAAPGSGGVSSGYAVTYRRTGGASVSMVSGGGGTQGTYKSLDSGGIAGTDRSPVVSHGAASRAERRAGMHISGPFSVTVPLHITSGLALGVLHGGRAEEEQALEGTPEEEQPKRGKQENAVEKDQGAEGSHEQAEKKSGGMDSSEVKVVVDEEKIKNENSLTERKEKKPDGDEEMEKVEEARVQEKNESRDEDDEDECLSKKEDSRQHASDRPSLSEETAEGDYMDMNSGMLQRPAVGLSEQLIPLSQEEGNPDHELPFDFQDTFGFLDLMDISVTSQVNEFSVEPPGFEEEEEEEQEEEKKEEDGKHSQTPACASQSQPPLEKPPLNTNLLTHRPLPGKSHSLPYKSGPSLVVSCWSSGESDDCIGRSDDDDDDSDKGEYECMFYKSLPSGHFQRLRGMKLQTVNDSTVESPQTDCLNQTHTEEVPEGIQDLPSPNPAENLPQTDAEMTANNGLDTHEVDEGDLSPLPLEMVKLSLDEKIHEDNNMKDLIKQSETKEAGQENQSIQESNEELEGATSTLESHSSSKGERLSTDSDVEEDTYFGPDTISTLPEPSNTETCFITDQLPSQDEHASSDGQQAAADADIAASNTTVTDNPESTLLAIQDESDTGQPKILTLNRDEQGETHSSKGGEDQSAAGETGGEEEEEVREISLMTGNFVKEESEHTEGEKCKYRCMGDGSEGAEELTVGAECETRKIREEGAEEQQVDADKIEQERDTITGNEPRSERNEEDVERKHTEKGKEGSVAGEENNQHVQEDDVLEENKAKTDSHLEGVTEIEEGSIPKERVVREMSKEDHSLSEESQEDSVDSVELACGVNADELQDEGVKETAKENENAETPLSGKEKPLRPPRMKDREEGRGVELGPGVGRMVITSKQSPLKVYQVKAVPVVPPKPQHSKITAFKQQFQQRDTERQHERQHVDQGIQERDVVKHAQQSDSKYNDTDQEERDTEKGDMRLNHEQGKGTDGECVEVHKQLKEGENTDQKERRGTWDGGSRRKDGQKDSDREVKRASAISMCFDEAVARATGKRCREKESMEKDRFVDSQ